MNKISITPIIEPKTITLEQAIEESFIANKIDANEYDIYIKNIKKNPKISKTQIKKYIGRGSSAIVFETNNGDILKLSRGSHYPLGRPHESFDVPVFQKGKVGNIRYYIEEKLYQHGLSSGFVEEIKSKIRNKGYRTYDLSSWDIQQIGISKNGELYLLDPECARFKTVFHAIWKNLKLLLNLKH